MGKSFANTRPLGLPGFGWRKRKGPSGLSYRTPGRLIHDILTSAFVAVGVSILLAGCRDQAKAPAAQQAPASAGALRLGDKLPDFELATYDGQRHRLADLVDGRRFVVVIWHSPACPCAHNCAKAIATEITPERYPDVAILGVLSDRAWDADWMKEDLARQQEAGVVTFPVVVDPDQSVRKLYGAERTPTVWVADREGRIRYWGAPENVLDPDGKGYRFLLGEALDALRAGQQPPTPRFDPIGCLIGPA